MDNQEQLHKVGNSLHESTLPVSPPPTKKRLPYILAGILLILLLGVVIYAAGQKYSIDFLTKKTSPSATQKFTTTPASSPSVSVPQIEWNTYTNEEYGFIVRFPKYSWGESCTPSRDINEDVLLTAFDDKKTNSIFIDSVKIAKLKYKLQKNGKYEDDYSTCEIVPNNLNLIKNGYDNGRPYVNEYSSNISKRSPFVIKYSRIENENQLNELAQSLYDSTCIAYKKSPVERSSGVFYVTLADKNGNNLMDGDCTTNFLYHFLYSPEHKSALITSGYQDGPFFTKDWSYQPEFEFIK